MENEEWVLRERRLQHMHYKFRFSPVLFGHKCKHCCVASSGSCTEYSQNTPSQSNDIKVELRDKKLTRSVPVPSELVPIFIAHREPVAFMHSCTNIAGIIEIQHHNLYW